MVRLSCCETQKSQNRPKMTQAGNLNPASSSSAAATTALPKNAQAMALLLQSMGVEDAEPRVVHQLLDLAFRTCTWITGRNCWN